MDYERKPKNTKTQLIINFTELGCQINTRPQNVKNYFMVTFFITDQYKNQYDKINRKKTNQMKIVMVCSTHENNILKYFLK